MADLFMGLIRFLHVASGVAMAGGVLMWSIVIAPKLQTLLPPHVRGPFLTAYFPRVAKYLTYAGTVAIVTGFWTMGLFVGFDGLVPAFQKTTWGIFLGIGAVAAITALGIANAVIAPTARKLIELGSKMAAAGGAAPAASGAGQAAAVATVTQQAPPAEMAALQKKLAVASMINVGLVFVILACMVAATHLGV